ncbi:hypothetical protein M569_00131 [Genlisea aurea]|uniref:Uncharacterized protein n=1 Tax=Genlisea aurea TaxID=192259 RepID=S8EP29_9LAMI|nr:hypothetical protein M569_00131 [Genlisea aurea]
MSSLKHWKPVVDKFHSVLSSRPTGSRATLCNNHLALTARLLTVDSRDVLHLTVQYPHSRCQFESLGPMKF